MQPSSIPPWSWCRRSPEAGHRRWSSAGDRPVPYQSAGSHVRASSGRQPLPWSEWSCSRAGGNDQRARDKQRFYDESPCGNAYDIRAGHPEYDHERVQAPAGKTATDGTRVFSSARPSPARMRSQTQVRDMMATSTVAKPGLTTNTTTDAIAARPATPALTSVVLAMSTSRSWGLAARVRVPDNGEA